jgi:hypothetical protein
MQRTSQSIATDGRDILFGVFGLVPECINSDIFRPNYSISFRHCLIGIWAHGIIYQRTFHLLLRNNPSSFYPSWIPGWRKSDVSGDFGVPRGHSEDALREMTRKENSPETIMARPFENIVHLSTSWMENRSNANLLQPGNDISTRSWASIN